MAEPFIGEIRIFAGNYAPVGWAFCAGQLLPISDNEALFNLIGITYGGDGKTTFALPDLRGRLPIHQGQGPGLPSYALGAVGGNVTAAVSVAELPAHGHAPNALAADGSTANPQGALPARPPQNAYAPLASPQPLAAAAVAEAGGAGQHSNLMPYAGVNYIIALFGLFPQAS